MSENERAPRLSTVTIGDAQDSIPFNYFANDSNNTLQRQEILESQDEGQDNVKPMSLWEKLGTEEPRRSRRGSNLKQSDCEKDGQCVLPDLHVIPSEVGTISSNLSQISSTCSDPDPQKKLRRFRMLARIKNNLAWTKEILMKQDDSLAFIVKSSETKPIVFDLNCFRASSSHAVINNRVRHILSKDPLTRTAEEQRSLLNDVINRMPCCQRFPAKMKKDLVRVCYYDIVGDGRVIIKQGHVGLSFYFIISGQVEVITNVKDEFGNSFNQSLGYLTTGSTFGEMALLHNTQRTATIISKGVVELLRVDKDDFDVLLYCNYKQEHCMRLDGLRAVPFMASWSQKDLEYCNNVSILKEYPPNYVLLGNCQIQDDTISFIVSGECVVLRRLWMLYQKSQWGSSRVIAFLDKNKYLKWMANPKKDPLITYDVKESFCQISVLKKGLYFGVGEDLRDVYLVTGDRVELLLVPSTCIIKVESSKRLNQMRQEFNNALPTTEELFNQYISKKKWRAYKESVVNEVLAKRQFLDINKPFACTRKKCTRYRIRNQFTSAMS